MGKEEDARRRLAAGGLTHDLALARINRRAILRTRHSKTILIPAPEPAKRHVAPESRNSSSFRLSRDRNCYLVPAAERLMPRASFPTTRSLKPAGMFSRER